MTQQIKCGNCRGMFDPEELKPCLYCDTMLCEKCLPECNCAKDFSEFDNFCDDLDDFEIYDEGETNY